MTEKLNHRDRLQAIFEGQKPDRWAASFWRHFFHLEHYAEGTAEAMVDFQQAFDWDFMKINPRADYHVQDWGVHLDYSHDEFAKHPKSMFPIRSAEDWSKIKPLPLDAPNLAEHLQVVNLIRKRLGPELPVLMTVFTPLSVAGRLVEDRSLLQQHIADNPEAVHGALEAITDTFARFAVELRNAGADGLFYATTQWASSDMMTWEQYREFGVPYDLRVIEASSEEAINLLHVCGSNNYLRELQEIDYHCQLVNWDTSDPTNLPLDQAYDVLPGKTLVGGVDHTGWLQHSGDEEIGHQIQRLQAEHDSSRLILGPGCSMPPETTSANLRAIRERL